jgi:hypothetical protein
MRQRGFAGLALLGLNIGGPAEHPGSFRHARSDTLAKTAGEPASGTAHRLELLYF